MEAVKNIDSIDTALKVFETASEQQGIAIEKGDYKSANKNYSQIELAVNFLKRNNVLQELEKFLNHPAVTTRIWSATYLLHLLPDKASKVLLEISKQEGIHSLTAEMTLKEWKNGNIK